MKDVNRRRFFKQIAGAFAAVPFMGLATDVFAEEKKCGANPPGKKFVTPEDKAAKRLDYVAVASESKNKKYKAGSACSNCKFYKDKKAIGDWAPCQMLANKYVASCGWCKSYKAKKK